MVLSYPIPPLFDAEISYIQSCPHIEIVWVDNSEITE